MEMSVHKYFTPREVSMHTTEGDLWVSFLGKVYDLSKLCECERDSCVRQDAFEEGRRLHRPKRCENNIQDENSSSNNPRNVLLKPILLAGGTDISHWFNPKTNDVRTYIDPETSCVIPYCPNGRYIHIPPPYPDSSWANNFGCPWWKDGKYIIGDLSQKTRFIKIVNTLTSQEHIIEVCTEERLSAIQERYLMYNQHAGSYTWKYNRLNLHMCQTLDENGIRDEDEDFYKLRMKDDEFLQTIHLYINDDLTEK